MERRRIVILGAAGRDFHDFLVLHRDDSAVEVIAVSAVRTGCGKSQTARFIAAHLATRGVRAAVLIVSGTPLDLGRLLSLSKPVVRARYAYREIESPGLGGRIDAFLAARGLGRA